MNDTDIIKGCIENDHKAERALYEKMHGPYFYSVCLKYVRNKYEAEDILQEAIVSALRHLKAFNGGCSFKAWLYRIVQNKAITHYNKEKRESLWHMSIDDYLSQEEGLCGFEDKFMAYDELKRATQILQKEAPMQFTNYRLYAQEEMSHKEIAEDLQITEVTSRSNYSRAVKKLRHIINRMDSYNLSA